MSPARPVPPALIAILSSPVSISRYAIVTLVEDEGSMPSVLRAVFGVLIFTPHAVNPLVRSTDTWKFGELRSVMRYRSEEHTSELQSLRHLVCRLLLEKNR